MLEALSEAIEARDPYARGHARRVTGLACTLARCLDWHEDRVATLRLGAQLHDIGKLAVDLEVLRKPAALTAEELAQVRLHPAVGARMLEEVDEARHVASCVLYHHERWDGRGYPTGRAGEQIPIEARVLAVADAFDAMTSFRPYSATLGPHEALDEVARCAGSQFDPRLSWLLAEAFASGEVDGAFASAERAAAS